MPAQAATYARFRSPWRFAIGLLAVLAGPTWADDAPPPAAPLLAPLGGPAPTQLRKLLDAPPPEAGLMPEHTPGADVDRPRAAAPAVPPPALSPQGGLRPAANPPRLSPAPPGAARGDARDPSTPATLELPNLEPRRLTAPDSEPQIPLALPDSVAPPSAPSELSTEPGQPGAAPSSGRRRQPGDVNPWPAAPPEPANFLEITPGQSTAEQVVQRWGEPVARQTSGRVERWRYERLGPFPHIEARLTEGRVDEIIVALAEAHPVAEIAQQLGLGGFRSAPVRDEHAALLGLAIPERGVVLLLEGGREADRVTHLVLQGISAEMFFLRAREASGDPARRLADVRQAERLAADDGRLALLAAELELELERPGAALAALERASEAGDAARASLLAARARLEKGDAAAARRGLEPLLARRDLPALLRAHALALEAVALMSQATPDYAAAMARQREAIHLAGEAQAAGASLADRRQARRQLVELHVAVAINIARGPWQDKSAVAAAWLRQASDLAAVAGDDGRPDPQAALAAQQGALAVYYVLGAQFDPSAAAESARELTRRLADDALPEWRQVLDRRLGRALSQAAMIAQARGAHDQSVHYAQEASRLLEPLIEEHVAARWWCGQSHFVLGTVAAASRDDHAQAARWFDSARRLLADAPLEEDDLDRGRRGERLVAMAVSYWRNDDRQRALELTRSGVALLEEAVDRRRLDRAVLAIPYGNLAAMHRELGQAAEARQYAELATQAGGGATRSAADNK